jgi:hypothetical protein
MPARLDMNLTWKQSYAKIVIKFGLLTNPPLPDVREA